MIKKYAFILLLILSVRNSYAYIDPGTTSTIIGGSVWSLITWVFILIGTFFVNYFFKPIKRGVIKLWLKIKRKN